MTRLIPLGRVHEKVREMARNCWDDHVRVDSIHFENLETVNISGTTHRLKPVAQRSISNRLGIPHQYLSRCPDELQRENIAYWIERERNETLFFRFDGDEIRAIFTPRYKPVDNMEVMAKLTRLGYGPETLVQCRLDSEFICLSIPDGKGSFSISKEEISPGVSITNSEVGLSSLSVSAFFLRLVCTNGLVSKAQVSASFRHVSERILTELPEVLDKVSRELEESRHSFMVSAETPVADPLKSISSFNRQFLLAKPEQEAVDWAWPYEQGDTMFHIVNTYTRAAHFEGLTAESAHRLQRVGGNILGMLR